MAEATGVFFYVFPGIAASAAFTLNKEGMPSRSTQWRLSILTYSHTDPAFGSIFQIGWAFALGIAFAIVTCAPTSGGKQAIPQNQPHLLHPLTSLAFQATSTPP